MSLKTAFASVLKATRTARGLSQKNLAEVSSRTYISKLERAQCSPTLEMMSALSVPLNLSPLTLIAMTMSVETGHSVASIVNRIEDDLAELAQAGINEGLQVLAPAKPHKTKAFSLQGRQPMKSHKQTEFLFLE
ncbi:helix-turn-helix domain-containing protein [Pseudomonas sp. 22447]|uniref:Helix-turn-helix domain-containing protein n=1 Tax=Pseudomonas viciae TaxID=2505979 RepID=A0A4P7PLD5_9PSED|nr:MULTISPECIES: helix-turn-helix domain-containing protein [Pseudomonas]PHN28383.1 XRE family transcriptional regulator [Pseudomonas sp. ICMP 564]QBZ91282.1 helix-turn-helix domain-containing protein [Pseudomonas viciae]